MTDIQPVEIVESQVFHEQKYWAYAEPLSGAYLGIAHFLITFENEETGRLMEQLAPNAFSPVVGHYVGVSEITTIIQTQDMNGVVFVERKEMNDLKTLVKKLQRYS